MQQQPYVDEQGKPVVPKDNTRLYKVLGIALLVLIFIIIIIIGTRNGAKNRKCVKLENLLESTARKYAEEQGIMPSIKGTSITIQADELFANGFLKQEEFQMKDNVCGGSIKFTKVEDEYIPTINVTNCDYCTTDTRYHDWSGEKEKKGSARIVDVIPYFNYVEKDTYYTEWTSYYSLEEIELYPFTDVKDERFPSIASDAKNVTIDVDTKMYYRYRDRQWMFYTDNGGSYSEFSSEQPSGYAYRDDNTRRTKECTPWSLDYPDKKDYRTIRDTYGYRWYYLDGKTKVYWNSGAYSPEQPNETYNMHEKEDVRMYCYEDDEWRWYNGARRDYSYYDSVMPDSYSYKDEGLTRYTDWYDWSTESKRNDSNSYYREEQSENRPRYRLKYDMYSFNKLEDSLSKEEFENVVGKTLQQIIDDPKYDLVVTYKYKTRKK